MPTTLLRLMTPRWYDGELKCRAMTKHLWIGSRTPHEFGTFFTPTYGNGEAAGDAAYGRMCPRASPYAAHRGTGADAEMPLPRLSARQRIGLCRHPHRSADGPPAERRIA